ncbi:MAG TPA: metallophosphoesterase [Polyangia bacterium]
MVPFVRDWTTAPAVFTASAAREIDALGDLHGDPDVAVRMLSAAGLITKTSPFHWAGEDRILIVTGDVIDKGTSALPIIDLFQSLEPEARAAGGAVVVLLGNHEAEFLADPHDSKSSVFQGELASRGLDPGEVAAGSGAYGAWLSTRPVAASIDGWFFCHAGTSAKISSSTLDLKFRALFDTPASAERGRVGFGMPFLTGDDSLLEATEWWKDGAGDPRATIDTFLNALPATHVVFGHDPGDLEFPGDTAGDRVKGQVVARYEGRLFPIDVGMSYAVGYSSGALLRITPGSPERVAVVSADGQSTSLWP